MGAGREQHLLAPRLGADMTFAGGGSQRTLNRLWACRQRRFQVRVNGDQLVDADDGQYGQCRGGGLPVGGDDRLHPGRITECRSAHVDDQDRQVLAGRGQQRPADLAGVGGIHLGGHDDNAMLADAPELVAFHGHRYYLLDGWRRNMSTAMSSWAGAPPTMAAITEAHAASGSWAVTAWHSR